MRTLTRHKVNGLNEALEINVLDAPGAGGASHDYQIRLKPDGTVQTIDWLLNFQNGPIKEAGFNGLTQEVLLAIIIDRLECFQRGPHACRENALALTKLAEAMHWLQHRTRLRLQAGVEGTHAPIPPAQG